MNCKEINDLMYSVEADYILAAEEYNLSEDGLYEYEQLILGHL